jgi:CRP-like cAMP-binding protein
MPEGHVQSNEAPVTNRLLAALPSAEWARIRTKLQPVSLSLGHVLWDVDEAVPLVYFPTAGIISALVVMEDGATIEGWLAGKEGATGFAAAFGVERSPWRMTVQADGEAMTITPADLQTVLTHAPVLQQLLFRYTHAAHQLATQSIACNRFHPIAERLARWLLLTLDRQESAQLQVTHEFLAQMLGTHRPSVTLALATLEQAGLISRAGRRRIDVLDRAGLESASCECYRRTLTEMDRVFRN